MHRRRKIRELFATQVPPQAASAWDESMSALDRALDRQGISHTSREARAAFEALVDGHGGESLDEWRRRSIG